MDSNEHSKAEAAKADEGFWSTKEFASYRDCSEGLLRKERIDGTGAPFIVTDANGRILYPIPEAKAFASRLPRFNSRAEAYVAHPALAERDERQAAVTERARASVDDQDPRAPRAQAASNRGEGARRDFLKSFGIRGRGRAASAASPASTALWSTSTC